MTAALEARSLAKDYPTRSGSLSVLRDCSLALERGESAVIVGPSGSGKSTLLNLIGTLEPPSSGSLSVEGENPLDLDETGLSEFRRRRIGFVFQDHHLLPQCTVLENVLLPALSGDAASDAESRARSLLEGVGLGARLDHLPSEISGGERQRAAVARALMNRPTVVLADEPTGNLDRSSAGAVADVLLALQASEKSVLVVVTHSDLLAGRFERRYEITEGRLTPV